MWPVPPGTCLEGCRRSGVEKEYQDSEDCHRQVPKTRKEVTLGLELYKKGWGAKGRRGCVAPPLHCIVYVDKSHFFFILMGCMDLELML